MIRAKLARSTRCHPAPPSSDAAATDLADLQALAAAADGTDWLVTLLTALCGGDHTTGFVMAEMVKKTAVSLARSHPVIIG